MSYAGIAKSTLEIIEAGRYQGPGGAEVPIAALVARAVQGTVLYRPQDLGDLGDLAGLDLMGGAAAGQGAAVIEVTNETTAAAGRRLVTAGAGRVVALNFASAKNPGGGFLGGARAQEEDLARCSALYPCLLTQRAYYDSNRACGSMLYTDHIIYSPDVPFFRDDRLDLLDQVVPLSIITAPAPNAGEAQRSGEAKKVPAVLHQRVERVLRVAALQGHTVLVLGAWGCGVFRNDPAQVAESFATWLAHPRYAGAFARVVFAVFDRRSGAPAYQAFAQRFAAR